MDRRLVAGLLLALAYVGCRTVASPSPKTVPRTDRVGLPGCYALYTGDGRPMGRDFYRASQQVQLDTARYQEPWMPVEWRLLIRLDSAGQPIVDSPPRPEPPLWRFDEKTDSLTLSFADGFSGAALSLHAPPGPRDTLRGLIVNNWDVGPPFSTSHASAYAVRIACPSAARPARD